MTLSITFLNFDHLDLTLDSKGYIHIDDIMVNALGSLCQTSQLIEPVGARILRRIS